MARFLRGLRLLVIDGFELDLPDTPANAAEFAGSGANRSAFCEARVVALAECGTHAFLAAESTAIRAVWESTGRPIAIMLGRRREIGKPVLQQDRAESRRSSGTESGRRPCCSAVWTALVWGVCLGIGACISLTGGRLNRHESPSWTVGRSG